MIFSEIYGAYYNTVAKIIERAIKTPLSDKDIRKIIEKYAFAESFVPIETALKSERWTLLFSDGTTPIKNTPTMPLTTLQRRWLKSISLDPRIKLFDVTFEELNDVMPLFKGDDYYIFDQYNDGDPFDDEKYIRIFRLILDAIKNQYPLRIGIFNRKGLKTDITVQPQYLEYSEKDNKFRVIVSGCRYVNIINLGRIYYCEKYDGLFKINTAAPNKKYSQTLVLELKDERNALERVLFHFSHFEKEAEKLGGNLYRIKILYDKNDETEMVIRILSFGPKIKVIEPNEFVELIKERLKQQMQYGI